MSEKDAIPGDTICAVCGKHIDQLEPFNSGEKLAMNYIEWSPDYPIRVLQCRECFSRYAGVWEYDEEKKLRRALTRAEKLRLRADIVEQNPELYGGS